MRGPRLETWDGPKHPEHDGLLELLDRSGQAWEDEEGWIYFIIKKPTIAKYEPDGKPFQYRHDTFIVSSNGVEAIEWPLFETNDRPLEHSKIMKRLA